VHAARLVSEDIETITPASQAGVQCRCRVAAIATAPRGAAQWGCTSNLLVGHVPTLMAAGKALHRGRDGGSPPSHSGVAAAAFVVVVGVADRGRQHSSSGAAAWVVAGSTTSFTGVENGADSLMVAQVVGQLVLCTGGLCFLPAHQSVEVEGGCQRWPLLATAPAALLL
jgi:hypothetical protein